MKPVFVVIALLVTLCCSAQTADTHEKSNAEDTLNALIARYTDFIRNGIPQGIRLDTSLILMAEDSLRRMEQAITEYQARARVTHMALNKSQNTLAHDSLIIGSVIEVAIYFEFGKAIIRPTSFSTLDSIATLLHRHPGLVVEAGVYLPKGMYRDNPDVIGLQRAESVVKYLMSKGIPPRNLVARGYGHAGTNDTYITKFKVLSVQR